MMPNRAEYYQQLKELAREKRGEFGIEGYSLTRTDLRRICSGCGVDRIDLWPPPHFPKALKNLRGAYFCDDYGCSIMIARKLPDEPAVFSMAHELKHHLVDRDLLSNDNPALCCDESNIREEVEIGAEIFAAELIFPEQDFLKIMSDMEVTTSRCRPEDLVRLKREIGTSLSYASLSKRAEFNCLAPKGTLSGYKGWKKLEERIYGEPTYKRILRYRAAGK